MTRKTVLDISSEIAGSFLFSTGIYSFIEKANVAPGGVGGISIMIKYLTGLPVGLMSLILNIPLLFLSYKFISREFTIRSIRCVLLYTFILDFIVTPFFPQYSGDRMIGSIFGGVFVGLGLGIIFLRGSSTAGTDILSCLIEKKYPQIQIGKAILLIDSVILLISAFVFQNIESALFGTICLLCQTAIVDRIVYSAEKGRNILIISQKSEKIAERIINEVKRGATFLDARGAFSKKSTQVLMCVVRVWEYHDVKKIIHEEDPSAFVIATEAEQIMGEGFTKAE